MAAKRIPKDLQEWIDARKRHHLSHAAVQMARELGMNPRTLGKIDNHKQEPWKAPLPDFIADLYEKRFGRESPDPVLTIEEIVEGKLAKKAERRAKRETQAAVPSDDQPKKQDDGPAKILRHLPLRRGHFVLESGYHTDLWLTLDALFIDWKTSLGWIRPLARRLKGYRVSAVCGPLVGGAFLAQSLARHSGLSFYYTERVQTPSSNGLFTAQYRLPAGLVEGAARERFAVVDDVISAGSSVRATVAALQSAGAKTIVVGSLLVLGTAAIEHFASLGVPLVALGKQEFNLWSPAECPQCQAGVALEDPVGASSH